MYPRLSLPGMNKISDSSNRYLADKISKDLASNIKDETLLNLCINQDLVTRVCNDDNFWVLKIKSMGDSIHQLYNSLINNVTPIEFYTMLMDLKGIHPNIIFPMRVTKTGLFFIDPKRQDQFSILVDKTNKNKFYYTLIPDIYIYELKEQGIYRKIGFDRGINTYDKWKTYINNEVIESIDKKDIDKYMSKLAFLGYLQVNENVDDIGEDLIKTNRAIDIPFIRDTNS